MSELIDLVASRLVGADDGEPRALASLLGALERVAGPLAPAVAWATGLLVLTLERGGTCLPLDEVAAMPESRLLPSDLADLDAEGWRARLAGELVGDGSDEPVRPLALVGDRLYFDRYARLEDRIAAALTAPAPATGADHWHRVAEAADDDGVRAVALALAERRVHLLSGGPGTGKTTSVARLLAAIARAHGPGALADVAVVAPTGKAAERLARSLASGAPGGWAPAPTTLHALLGIGPDHRHRRGRPPLAARLVVCDETSMVDVASLDELLGALAPECRLLLVGDPDQLQSVDLGSVMGDLVAAPSLSRTTLREVRRVEGASAATRASLLELFADVREGNAARVLERLRAHAPGTDFLAIGESPTTGALATVLDEAVERAHALGRIARGDGATPLPEALESVMVLCAQHEGPLGRRWWSDRIAERVGQRLGPVPGVGVPVLVTRTDRANGVVNGDTGLVRESARGAVLHRPDRDLEDVPVATLTHWQPWWAMTIHKSQGSEFDHVVVVVPPGSRLVSRELLYTALTRARSRVSVVARPEDVLDAVARPVRRLTGLTAAVVRWSSSPRPTIGP